MAKADKQNSKQRGKRLKPLPVRLNAEGIYRALDDAIAEMDHWSSQELVAAPGAAEDRPEGPQANRVLKVLPKLYPPHGVVPFGIPIKTVVGQIADALVADNRKQRLGPPRWDVTSDCVKYLRALHS